MGVNVLIFTDNHHFVQFIRGVGAYRIATEIRNAGYTCQVIDFFGFLTETDIEKIIEKYVDEDTLAIGFGSTFITKSIPANYVGSDITIEQHIIARNNMSEKLSPPASLFTALYPFDDHIIKRLIIDPCKEKNPNIKFVYGGVEALRQDAPFIDCFFYTFNDRSIIDYLDKVKNKLSLPTSYSLLGDYPEFDFNKSQTLWHESDHIFQGETLPLETARGCIFKCKFCSFPLKNKSKFDYLRDPEILREEIVRNYEQFGVDSYFFTDDTFNDSTQKLELIFNKVTSKLPFKINISVFLRMDLLNAHREQIQLLKDMGLKCCYFGIETITPEAQRIIGKVNPISKIEQLSNILKAEWTNDVNITGSFIFGLPGETRDSLEFTKKWLIEDSLNYFNHTSVNPLWLNLDKKLNPLYKSDIDIDLEKYGYEDRPLPGVHGNWHSKSLDLGFVDMAKHAKDVRTAIYNDDRCRLAGFWSIGLYTLGYSHSFLTDISYKDAMKTISNNTSLFADKIREYKSKILL